jgi:hypothetical protein
MEWWHWTLITLAALLVLARVLAEDRTDWLMFTAMAVIAWVAVLFVSFGAGWIWASGGGV